MLHDLQWLRTGKEYPPACERDRITRYCDNQRLFESEHFGDQMKGVYKECVTRILREDALFGAVSFPVILNYQRAISLKTADLVCGEHPKISSSTDPVSQKLEQLRADINFDNKLYAAVIDLSRFGDAVLRVYKDEITGKGDFTVWSPKEWYPIVMDDGTYRIKAHTVCWRTNIGTTDNPHYQLHAQIHYNGYYDYLVFDMDCVGSVIGKLLSSTKVQTGLTSCAIRHLRNLSTSGTVFGSDDYTPIDSLLSEILVRIGQISRILDKHADPSLTGPASMLERDPKTNEKVFKPGRYYAYSPGEEPPQYLTWDGQLEASFQELDMLLKQLYMLSELGEALMGAMSSNGQAISGTAMRFKLANPLIKARRVSNALTLPIKKLLESVSELGYGKIDASTITVEWKDGLPDDPKEQIENALLATGSQQLMPTQTAIEEFFRRSPEEAKRWVEEIAKELPQQPKNVTKIDPRESSSGSITDP